MAINKKLSRNNVELFFNIITDMLKRGAIFGAKKRDICRIAFFHLLKNYFNLSLLGFALTGQARPSAVDSSHRRYVY
jgi:hypothetical protein